MKPLALPRVRITSVLTCPNTMCARMIYSPTIRVGESWMKCNVAEKQRRGGCPAHWLNITLPPRSTGLDIVHAVGREGAAWIVSQITSSILGITDVLPQLLTSESDRPVHIQIATRARDEHHLRYAPIADVLRTLQISLAA